MVYEEYLIHNSTIFKKNLYYCNLGIYLVDSSIIYIKFMDTTILSLNIKGKFCII